MNQKAGNHKISRSDRESIRIMEIDIEQLHSSAVEIAKKGGAHTLLYFQKEFDIEQKDDMTPVTKADRQSERIMREEISRLYPDHGILGEEFDRHNPDSVVQWILDPIDGTFSFVHGVPFYTTLIGILVDDEPVAGVIYAPALDELCEAAKGRGARWNGKRCQVRSCQEIEQATVLSTDVTTAPEYDLGEPFEELLQRSNLHRTWGDAYGHMMVATGRADLMFDPVLSIWDAAPLLPILREAGGVYCDVEGNETIETGNGLSCSRELLPEVLKVFDRYE